MKSLLAAMSCTCALVLAGCANSGGDGADAAADPAGGDGSGDAAAVPGSIEEQLAALEPDEQRAYIATLAVRDGCLNHRADVDAAVPAMIAAGFEAATITNVPDMQAANSGNLRIYSDTNPARGERSLCAVDLPLENFDKFVAMIDAMVEQNFPGAERGVSNGKPAWKLEGAPETFIIADDAIESGDATAALRMGAITFIAR